MNQNNKKDEELDNKLKQAYIEFVKERKKQEDKVEYWKNGFFILLWIVVIFIIGTIIR
ncbi:hypothetical protein [Gallibacterium sp. AGMB14963]|uniref:hypothetical protein n=1 Tax=Gallibacterium faecale TaxID=3019086 RepID=UPI0022F166A5|nr:hypothetical protein [Gallibacterium sp. AGMB14963]MDA3978982.1 hypothetical protein [Gallibacterium sp. AGMB14963]